MPRAYLFLTMAVLSEGLGAASLQASQQLTRPVPVLGVVVGFGASFYFLIQVLKYMPLGVAYALWSGLGICLTAFLGWVFFRQTVDFPALAGMGLIIAGIAVINLFSNTASY